MSSEAEADNEGQHGGLHSDRIWKMAGADLAKVVTVFLVDAKSHYFGRSCVVG